LTTPEVESVLEEMTRTRGWYSPTHEYLARNDPDFLKEYNTFNGRLLHRSMLDQATEKPELELKYRHLLVAVLMAFRALDKPKISRHLQKVLEYGGSERLIVEAFQVAMVPGGAPTLHLGIEALIAALKQAED
jgi:alkylhydroperoxidase/carboxymuconolactone decarboxylase family protein YurZ